MKDKVEILNGTCICGNTSSYDKESLEASTWTINGVEIVLECLCEDELLSKLLKSRLNIKRIKEIANGLMSEEKEDIMEVVRLAENKEDD